MRNPGIFPGFFFAISSAADVGLDLIAG